MGAAEDPDIDDYYNKSHEFPLTYSPEKDPEVIEEMRVAAAELERGENSSEGEEDGDDSDESLATGGSGSENDGPKEGWEDIDDEDGFAGGGQLKRMKGIRATKSMSAIEKVHTIDFSMNLAIVLIWPYSSM